MDDKEKMLIMAKLLRGAMGGGGESSLGPMGSGGGGDIMSATMDVGIEELERRRAEEERKRLMEMQQGM